MKRFGMVIKLMLGIGIGTLIGMLGIMLGIKNNNVYIFVIRMFITFNSLFATFLSFLIPLLILTFVSVGLADLGKKANKLFGITLALAYGTTIISGFVAFFLSKAILPIFISPIPQETINVTSLSPLFTLNIDPIFPVMTALVLAFVFGLGMANIKKKSLLDTMKNAQEIISLALNKIIIPLIPVHIAGLFCNIAYEGRLFATAKTFTSIYVLIILLQLLYIVSQFAIASFITKKSFIKSIKNILPCYFTAIGTQSSASTIPVSLKCAYDNEVKKDIADFVVPLCATINLNGDTICLVVGAIGIMLSQGMNISLLTFAPFILMLGITMVAAPGIPGGGVMAALGLITSMLGFTDPMQQLIIALHFSQDSFGTATNVSGDQALAIIVDKIDK